MCMELTPTWNNSIPYLVQSSDEGIGTTLSDDTIDAGPPAPEERWAFIEIEPDWDQHRYWQQKTWENSITECVYMEQCFMHQVMQCFDVVNDHI